MRIKTALLSLLSLLLLLFASVVNANIYYVATTGSDNASGAIGTPFKTIGQCTTQITADGGGGHTCFVRGGDYAESITPAAGADANHKNTYAAYNGETVTVPRVFFTTGQSYVRIIGFNFTGALGNIFTLYSTTGVEILYNKFIKTAPSSTIIKSDNASNSGNASLIIRGNEFSYIGCTWDTDHCSNDSGGAIMLDLKGDKNIVVEYNTASNIGNDVFGYCYSESLIRNNYIYNMDTERDWPNKDDQTLPHQDIMQGASSTVGLLARNRIFLESNVQKDWGNNQHKHFMLVNGISGYDDLVIRGNVVHNIGGEMLTLDIGDRSRLFNNTLADLNQYQVNSYSVKYGNTSQTDASENNINKNNIYYATNNTGLAPVHPYINTIAEPDIASTVTGSTNLCYLSGGSNDSENACTQTTDPLFANYSNDSFYIGLGSPARSNGTAITTVTSESGSGTAFIVADAGYFTAGFGISGGVALGDKIKIGGNPATTITSINYDTNEITVADSQTWTNGDSVYWRNQDTSPDIGAYEYKSSYVLTGTWSLSGGTVTVVPNDSSLVRFVEVLENGVPVGTATASPYTVSGVGDGTVTVKMFSLYASETPIVAATTDEGGLTRPCVWIFRRVDEWWDGS
jgi:hypothetical protein